MVTNFQQAASEQREKFVDVLIKWPSTKSTVFTTRNPHVGSVGGFCGSVFRKLASSVGIVGSLPVKDSHPTTASDPSSAECTKPSFAAALGSFVSRSLVESFGTAACDTTGDETAFSFSVDPRLGGRSSVTPGIIFPKPNLPSLIHGLQFHWKLFLLGSSPLITLILFPKPLDTQMP